MQSRNHLRSAGIAAALAAIVAAGAAGCGPGSSGASSGSGKSSAPTVLTAAQMLSAAAKQMQQVNSFSATMDMKMKMQGQSINMAGTVQEQVRPTVLAEIDFPTLESGGQNLGPMSEIVNKQAIYMKMPMLGQVLQQSTHTSKPWVEIPLSSVGSGNLSQLLGQAQNTSPLSATQLLVASKDVKKAGTSTVNGVQVTELTGTAPATAAIAKLPASLRSTYGQDLEKLGIGTIKFQVWVDGQDNARKEIVNMTGSTVSEELTSTVTSINQPVKASIPPSSQVEQIPASVLSGAGM